jgi:hypothetical protein
MKCLCLVLAGIFSLPVFAGDLWQVNSTSAGPDGTPLPFEQKLCFPKDGIDPAQILGSLGNCTFDRKQGNASAMTFSLSCKTAGMPAELAVIKVDGDASLSGNKFSMKYVIIVNANQGSPADAFKMSGKTEAVKVGVCELEQK